MQTHLFGCMNLKGLKLMNDIDKINAAIKNLKAYMYYAIDDMPIDVGNAITEALTCLREKLQRLDNPPLTIEQLKQMDKVPIYIKDLDRPISSGWKIIYWDRGKYMTITSYTTRGYLIDYYGIDWLAYRQKPTDET